MPFAAERKQAAAERKQAEDSLAEGSPVEDNPAEDNPVEDNLAEGSPAEGAEGVEGIHAEDSRSGGVEDNLAEGDPAEDISVEDVRSGGSRYEKDYRSADLFCFDRPLVLSFDYCFIIISNPTKLCQEFLHNVTKNVYNY